MAGMPSTQAIPLAVTDEAPFVVHTEPDTRAFLDVEGYRLRRGPDRIIVEVGEGALWVKFILMDLEPGTFAMASLGPLLDPFWDAFAREGTAFFSASEVVRCPLLLSALAHRSVAIDLADGVTIPVNVLPPGEGVEQSFALIGTEGHALRELDPVFFAAGSRSAMVAIGILNELASLDTGPATPATPGMSATQWMDLIGKGADTMSKVLDVLSKASQLLG